MTKYCIKNIIYFHSWGLYEKIVYKKLAALGLASLLGSPLGCSPDKNEPVSEDIVNAPTAAIYDVVKIETPKEDNIEDLIDFD